MPLTDTKIRNLKGTEKPYKVSDGAGLHLLVKPNGSRLWRYKYRLLGKEKVLSIGMYPDVSLADARRATEEARIRVAGGEDPSALKVEARRQRQIAQGETFAKMAESYLDKQFHEGLAKVTIDKNRWYLGMGINDFGNVGISEIGPPTVLRTLKKIEAKGNYETARRVRATVGAVFRYAIASGLAENDPTFALRGALITPKVKPRAAIIDKQQLGGLLRAIDGYEGQATTRIGLKLLALLYPRPGELRQANWDEFNIDEAVWTIPEVRMKMRRPHRIPLPLQAITLLQELRDLTGAGKLILPSLRSFHRPISENTLNAALRRLGYSGDEMTSHGFRASFSTIANESGLWNPDAIERALAHVEANEVRRAYARGEHWDERFQMARWWANTLDELRLNRS